MEKETNTTAKGELFTKGEWTAGSYNTSDYIDIESDRGRICSLFIENEDGETGELDHEFNEQQKANARLLVESKNMYEVLKTVLSEVPLQDEGLWEDSAQARMMKDLHKKIETILNRINNK